MTFPTTPGTHARARPPIAAVLRRLAATGALALTVFAVSAGTATAGESESIKTDGGHVTFEHRDEEVTAEDTRVDGLGVQAVLVWVDETDHNRTVFVVDATGADDLSKFKDLTIREGTRVALTMCYVDDFGPSECSRTQTGET
jgi:hypothetical protein